MEIRYDNKRVRLRKGESQRKDGTYSYRWTSKGGKRNTIYAKTLQELREKTKDITKDILDGISDKGRNKSVNDVFDMWLNLKKGIKENTLSNYVYMYETYVRDTKLAQKKVMNVKKSDVKAFYNSLHDEKNLKINTIDVIHNVLHQVFDVALEDEYIRVNPTDNALKELKMAHRKESKKVKALTIEQEKSFLQFIMNTPKYRHWYPIMKVMLGTGMRVGEVTGLRWEDIDLENGIIDVNHTLVYYSSRESDGCRFAINTTKTIAGNRRIAMSEDVKNAFIEEKEYQDDVGLGCKSKIDGYTNFIFINRFGEPQHNGTLNKAIGRIIRDYNDEQLLKEQSDVLMLPKFSCHSLRHTFTTRMCEAGVNIKVIQETLGHSDFSITMNVYTDVTQNMKNESLKKLQQFYADNGL